MIWGCTNILFDIYVKLKLLNTHNLWVYLLSGIRIVLTIRLVSIGEASIWELEFDVFVSNFLSLEIVKVYIFGVT